MFLKTRWTTLLGSALRFDAHVANATIITQRLLGITPASRSLTWIPTTHPGRFCALADDVISEDDTMDDVNCASHDSLDVGLDLDSDQTVLSDILATDDHVDSGQGNGLDGERTGEIGVVWALPVSDLAVAIIEDDHIWLQTHVQADALEDILCVDIGNDDLRADIKRTSPKQLGLPSFVFEAGDIDILTSPTARLNDVCINGGAIVLYRYISSLDPTHAQRCAILSTFELVRIRNDVSDTILWRNISHTLLVEAHLDSPNPPYETRWPLGACDNLY
jgi:hypothetical protein